MTSGTDPVAEVEEQLVRLAGGYLRNVVRELLVTCRVCGTPVDGYERSYRCYQLASTFGIADLVVPLTYGIDRMQSGILLRHYKDNVSPQARQQHRRVIWRLLYLGLVLHQRCIERRIGQPVTSRVTVPSLQGRAGAHPFTAIAHEIRAVDDSLALVPSAAATNNRIVSSAQFDIVPQRNMKGEHVLVLDDTWTTGSRTQSAALALHDAGADHVSVMVLGRWLSQTYGNNAEFIRAQLRKDYNPRICPVTGGDCP